jgi:hypothetical protein
MSVFDSAVSVYSRGRDPLSLLRYEASKKPELSAICESAGEYTAEQIDALPYLPWIRSALKTLSARARVTQIDLTDYVMDEGFTADPAGVMFEYTGDDIFVPAGGSQLQVRYGKLFFVDHTHRVWVENVEVKPDRRLFGQSNRVGLTTKTGYFAEHQARLQRLHPSAPQTVVVGAPSAPSAAPQPLAHLGVTIQR